jgi:hypothetical protein
MYDWGGGGACRREGGVTKCWEYVHELSDDANRRIHGGLAEPGNLNHKWGMRERLSVCVYECMSA